MSSSQEIAQRLAKLIKAQQAQITERNETLEISQRGVKINIPLIANFVSGQTNSYR